MAHLALNAIFDEEHVSRNIETTRATDDKQREQRFIDFIEYCKVGKVTLGETIRMKENCETFGLDTGELSCFFTTGFLNGFFSAVKNQHVKETKCIAMGDPYCEWEFR